MTREEAIKFYADEILLLELAPTINGDNGSSMKEEWKRQADIHRLAIAALREQPQWISVKDALPVINDNEPLEEFATDRGYTFIVSDGKYVWTELFLLKANKFDDESVTHWMPMPLVPPKEEV